MQVVSEKGFKVGLHTAGIYPERLRELLPFVDWVGFDVKAPFDQRYERITGIRDSHKAAFKSLGYLLESKKSFQLRCTVHPLLLSEEDMEDLKGHLYSVRSDLQVLIQTFSKKGCVDKELLESA
jgi:pyruvate formate lyase activating enzyme